VVILSFPSFIFSPSCLRAFVVKFLSFFVFFRRSPSTLFHWIHHAQRKTLCAWHTFYFHFPTADALRLPPDLFIFPRLPAACIILFPVY
jgi:hypothetical protein